MQWLGCIEFVGGAHLDILFCKQLQVAVKNAIFVQV